MSIPIICPKNYSNCGVKTEYDPKRIFVLMPFREEQAPQRLYSDVLASLLGWSVYRADTDFSKPEIWCKICSNIQSSRAVIADLSDANANVFLELGFAWGLGRPFVLLAQDTRSLPFDTRTFHVIQYERAGASVKNSDEVRSQVLRFLGELPNLPLSPHPQVGSPEEFLEQRIADAKNKTAQLWRRSDNRFLLPDGIRIAYRIGISLLQAYPASKRTDDIALDVGVSSWIVRGFLLGRRADAGRYFRKIETGWTLSDDGLYWMFDEVVPAVFSQ